MTVHLKTGPSTTNSNHLLVIVVSFLLLTVTVLVAFGFFVVEKDQRTVSPLKAAVHRIQIETEEVHHWVQNMLATPSIQTSNFYGFNWTCPLPSFVKCLKVMTAARK